MWIETQDGKFIKATALGVEPFGNIYQQFTVVNYNSNGKGYLILGIYDEAKTANKIYLTIKNKIKQNNTIFFTMPSNYNGEYSTCITIPSK